MYRRIQSYFPFPSLVNQERRRGIEERAQDNGGLFGQAGFFQGRVHQSQPTVAGFAADGETDVAHAQSGMAAGFDISRRASEAEDQKVAEALLGAGEIFFSVQRAQKIVKRNAAVEGGDQARETFLTD